MNSCLFPVVQIDSPTHGTSDFVCGHDPASLAMCRAHFGMYAMLKSPLVISAWLPSLSHESRSVLTNPVVIGISQDSLGVQARRIKSVTPANTTISAPRDVQAVLAHCDPTRSTQQWRVTPRAGLPRAGLVTRPCNSSAPDQRFTHTETGEIRIERAGSHPLCVDSNTSTSKGAEAFLILIVCSC